MAKGVSPIAREPSDSEGELFPINRMAIPIAKEDSLIARYSPIARDCVSHSEDGFFESEGMLSDSEGSD